MPAAELQVAAIENANLDGLMDNAVPTPTTTTSLAAALESILASKSRSESENLASCMRKYILDPVQSVYLLKASNHVVNEELRTRISSDSRILAKIQLLLEQGWPTCFVAIGRALPNCVEKTANGRQVLKQSCLDAGEECVETADGMHRVAAVRVMELQGCGPGDNPSGQWITPTMVLAPETPEAILRGIGYAMTTSHDFTFVQSSIDLLFSFNNTYQQRWDKGESVAAQAIADELTGVAGTSMTASKAKWVHNLMLILRVRDEHTQQNSMDEVLRLYKQNHVSIYQSVVKLAPGLFKEFEDVSSNGLLGKTNACFLPLFGSGNFNTGGYVPGQPTKALGTLSPRSQWSTICALFRFAYSFWILSRGKYPTRDEYLAFLLNTEGHAIMHEDVKLIQGELGQAMRHTTLLPAMEVLAMGGKRSELNAVIERWKLKNPSLDIAKSGVYLAGFAPEKEVVKTTTVTTTTTTTATTTVLLLLLLYTLQCYYILYTLQCYYILYNATIY
jgi:hypothetical protein